VLPLFTAADGELDWDVPTRTLMCLWTACTMGGTPVTVPIDGVRRTVRGLRVVADSATSDRPGTVLSSLGSDHIVAASDGLMLVEVDEAVQD
jgi:methionyl-tRNA formyltransferase